MLDFERNVYSKGREEKKIPGDTFEKWALYCEIKGMEFLTFVFQVTCFQYVLVLYNVVNTFLLSFAIIQVSLKMLLKIVL